MHWREFRSACVCVIKTTWLLCTICRLDREWKLFVVPMKRHCWSLVQMTLVCEHYYLSSDNYCNYNWGIIMPSTRRPRAHHRVCAYPDSVCRHQDKHYACRQNQIEMFSQQNESGDRSSFRSIITIVVSMLSRYWQGYNTVHCMPVTSNITTTTTILQLSGFWPGLSGWAGTRKVKPGR